MSELQTPSDHPELYIFDFCGTLFEGNTTVAFLDFLRAKAPWTYSTKFYMRWIVAGFLRRMRMISGDGYMKIRIAVLRGLSRRWLQEQAEHFVDEYLLAIRKPKEWTFFQEKTADGSRIAIASYSLDIIVEAFARNLKLERTLGSELEFGRNEMCTGKYKIQLQKEGKLHHLLSVYDKETLRNSLYMTDDALADRDLVSFVRYPVLAVEEKTKNRHSSLRTFLLCLPGVYYYITRYRYAFERVMHIFKYWVTYAALLFLISGEISWRQAIVFIAGWLAFMSVYDIFARENDEFATTLEPHPTTRSWQGNEGSVRFAAIKGLMIAMLLGAVCFLGGRTSCIHLAGLLLAVAGIFAVHNRMASPVRIITFYALYISKGLLFLLLYGPMLTASGMHAYLTFIFLFNLSYLPSYATQKLGNLSCSELTITRLGLVRYVFVLPIFYKNLFLCGGSLFCKQFLLILLWINVLTAVEWAWGRFRHDDKAQGA